MVQRLEIRTATPDDALLLAKLHVASWRSAYRDFLPATFLAGLNAAQFAEEHWRPLLEAPTSEATTIVGRIGRDHVGLATVEIESRVPPPEEAHPGHGYVHHIHVAPDQLGRGVGLELWREAMTTIAAWGYQRATLGVYAPNARARRFYEAAGWAHDGWSVERTFTPEQGGGVVQVVRYAGPVEGNATL